jgi:hypothetical protein
MSALVAIILGRLSGILFICSSSASKNKTSMEILSVYLSKMHSLYSSKYRLRASTPLNLSAL